MPITKVEKNPDDLMLRATCEFDAPVERVWQVWADPRQLEQWWGPPGVTATIVNHDLTEGARTTYYMTDPDHGEFHGWWSFAGEGEQSMINGKVDIVEALGEVTLLYVRVEGHEDPVLAKLGGHVQIERGTEVHLTADGDALHLFNENGNSMLLESEKQEAA